MKRTTYGQRIAYLTRAGIIAALYVALTGISAMFGLAGTGAIQLRISEALCILPVFTAAAVPGLTVGCLISNIFFSGAWPDIVFGTLATLLGAWGTGYFRRAVPLAMASPVVANTVIIPFVIRYAYVNVEESLSFLFLTVGIGEALSVFLFGTLLYLALRPVQHRIFGDSI